MSNLIPHPTFASSFSPNRILFVAAILGGLSAPAAGNGLPQKPTPSTNVWINEVRLADRQVRELESVLALRVHDGSYWYDRVSGAYGLLGGPTAGFILPGLNVGGPLKRNASNGDTGVIINGREIHRQDVSALQAIVPVWPGRYWVDSRGFFGYENGPAIGNLIFLAHAASGGGGGGGYNRSTYGGYIGSDGDTSYYFDAGSGCSVMSGAGVSC